MESPNATNLTDLESFACVARDTHALLVDHVTSEELSVVSTAVGAVATIFGVAIATLGAYIIRAIFSLTSGALMTIAIGMAMENFTPPGSEVSCHLSIVILLGTFLVGCFVGCTALKLAVFLLGFACGAGLVYSFFLLVPTLDNPMFGLPVLSGHSLVPFWASAFVGGVLVGIVVRWKEKELLAYTTPVLGGVLVSYGVHILVLSESGDALPMEAYGAISISVMVVGWAVQWRIKNRKQIAERRRLKKEKKRCESVRISRYAEEKA